jgi:lipopolysaccharide/colanic/teichoic acid biosynthesis glycosyltransferase
LDELPQLLNVLRGDMSLVGPRPEVPEYVAAYSPDQKMVLAERPGITGPASLAYIDEEKVLADRPDPQAYYVAVLMPRKLALDLAYCANVNFLTDVRLILATLKRMFGLPEKG